jgi:hypothetical protein
MIETPAFATSIIKRIIVEGKFILSFNFQFRGTMNTNFAENASPLTPAANRNEGSLTVKLNNRSCLFAGGELTIQPAQTLFDDPLSV